MMRDQGKDSAPKNESNSIKFDLYDNILMDVHEKQLENNLKSFMETHIVFEQMVSQGKSKIQQQFQERRRAVETAGKIQRSSLINKHHMIIAQMRHKMCEEIFEAVLRNIKLKIEEDQDEYCLTLIKLIVEGALRMFQPELQVKCLPEHMQMVERVLQAAQETFNAVMEEQTGRSYPISIRVNTIDTLQMRQLDQQHGQAFSKKRQDLQCVGGIILTDRTGNITYKNTIDTRINILREICLPVIRVVLWPNLQPSQAPK